MYIHYLDDYISWELNASQTLMPLLIEEAMKTVWALCEWKREDHDIDTGSYPV